MQCDFPTHKAQRGTEGIRYPAGEPLSSLREEAFSHMALQEAWCKGVPGEQERPVRKLWGAEQRHGRLWAFT